jgi:hypothetical protein
MNSWLFPVGARSREKVTMRMPKRWRVSILLFALATPAIAYAGSGGPKDWFHFPRVSSATQQHLDNHPPAYHYIAKHPKPPHARNLSTRISKRNKPS